MKYGPQRNQKQVHKIHIFWPFFTYSRVPNKRTGHLLENEKKSRLYALIWDYSFIDFEQIVPPICLFPPILLNIFELFHCLIFGITNYHAKVLIH